MSQENVEVFKRFNDAQNRRDVEAMLDELDAEVEWHPSMLGSLRGGTTVLRSGAETESPVAAVVDFRNGKAIRVWTYLDDEQALEAAGLRE